MHLRVMATVNGSPDVEEAWKQHGLLAEYAKASNPVRSVPDSSQRVLDINVAFSL